MIQKKEDDEDINQIRYGEPNGFPRLIRHHRFDQFKEAADVVDELAQLMAGPKIGKEARPFVKKLWDLSDSINALVEEIEGEAKKGAQS